jgi:hypothetical protein
MPVHISKLIPVPCPESWDAMDGEGDRRHCDRCSKVVHDLSGATELELRDVIARREVQCVRLRVDAKGMVVTALAVLAACTPHIQPEEPVPEPTVVRAPDRPIVPMSDAPVQPDHGFVPSPYAALGMVTMDGDDDLWGKLDVPAKGSEDLRGARERPRVRAKD